MFSDRLRVDHRIGILTAGIVILMAGAIFFCGLSLRAVHNVVIPCFLGYVVLFRKDMLDYVRWYHFFYFVLLTVTVAAYLVALAHMIPEIRVRWSELPIAIWFLLSIHIMIWLIDRIVDKALSTLFRLRPGVQSRHRLHFTKTVLRILCVTTIAVPYLFAVFMVHWIKFADDTDPRRELGVDFTRVHFQATDSTQLEGWFIPATRESSDSTVIIAPGHGTTKACFLPYAMILCSNGYNVLLFDFRGQGASHSHTRSFGLFETNDVLGAVRYLKQVHPQASRYVFGLGISHGAPAIITAAAHDERIRAIILDSAILNPGSLPDRTLCRLPWPVDVYIGTTTKIFASAILGHNLFREVHVQKDIAQIHPRPVLIFHGSADRIADYAQANELYAQAKHPKKLCIIPGAGHEQVLLYTRNNYIIEIRDAIAGGM